MPVDGTLVFRRPVDNGSLSRALCRLERRVMDFNRGRPFVDKAFVSL